MSEAWPNSLWNFQSVSISHPVTSIGWCHCYMEWYKLCRATVRCLCHNYAKYTTVKPLTSGPSWPAAPFKRPFFLAPFYFLCKFYVTKPLVTGHPANAASGRWIWCPVTLMSVMSATKGAARDCNWHLDGPDRPAVTASSQRLAGQARRGVKFTAAEPSSGQALWPAFDGDLLNCHNDVVKLTISVSDNVFETL